MDPPPILRHIQNNFPADHGAGPFYHLHSLHCASYLIIHPEHPPTFVFIFFVIEKVDTTRLVPFIIKKKMFSIPILIVTIANQISQQLTSYNDLIDFLTTISSFELWMSNHFSLF